MFIAGLNRFEKRHSLDKNKGFSLENYEYLLDELMTFNTDEGKIKDKISLCNQQIISLLSSGEILPYAISRNFEFLPNEVLDSVVEAEWQVDSRYSLKEFRAFVNIMVRKYETLALKC